MSSQSKPMADLRDTILSKLALRELYLECFDECVYNDLPQYLIRTRDMRLFAREELWEIFRPLVDTIPLDLENARSTKKVFATRGDWQLKQECKVTRYVARIKQRLKFAIFSHRWGIGEPTFRDMSSKIHGERPTPEGAGYRKLLRFCAKAKDYGCDFVWSDTCCINKESSAELDEAIRSMYRWYSDAHVCIAYLAKSSSVDDFPREPWFTRGWTLQELLGTEKVENVWQGLVPNLSQGERGRGPPSRI
ncbi:hypothetical protein J3R83DRAFT_5948 [Lanmaoa asiatica]|nr:hypothetical protein J3R83DRAFT_5948 [Lanmaoa asiatica]